MEINKEVTIIKAQRKAAIQTKELIKAEVREAAALLQKAIKNAERVGLDVYYESSIEADITDLTITG